jgi:uncharacterized protein (DUF58 family)
VITYLKTKGFNYWNQWIKKRKTAGNPQILEANTVYILPSGFGCAYGFLLLTLFSGAINYQISTVFLMTFLLAVIGLVSAWEAHANLKELSIKLIAIKDAQSGTPAQITLLIQGNNKMRYGLEFKLPNQPASRLEMIPAEGMQYVLPIETSHRGCFPLPRIVISSLFPFGIFRVWGYASFDAQYYVYPEPVYPEFWPSPVSVHQERKRDTPGDDEIYDLKQVEDPWSQPNLIAWKIAAKGQGWYLKTRNNSEGDYWLFRLNDLSMDSLESRLEHLSYWLVNAEADNRIYGLELGHYSSPFAQGEEHLQACLRQLATY